MPVKLPLDASDPIYRVGVTLADIPYLLDVHWNGRDGAWYMDILDNTENPIVCGVKLVLGAVLGGRCRDSRFPRGLLFAADTSGKQQDAGIDDLGTRVVILFYSVDELKAGKPSG